MVIHRLPVNVNSDKLSPILSTKLKLLIAVENSKNPYKQRVYIYFIVVENFFSSHFTHRH